jgi:O-antigen ligase
MSTSTPVASSVRLTAREGAYAPPLVSPAVAERAGLWCVRAAALALPLISLPTMYDGYVLPKVLAARVVIALLSLVLVARWYASGSLALRRTPLDVPLLVLLVGALISTAVSVNANVAFFGTYLRYDGWLTLATYAALYWLSVATLRDAVAARSVLPWAAGGAAFAGALAVTQTLAASAAVTGESAFTFAGFARADATMANPNTLAVFLALMLPITVELALRAPAVGSRTAATAASLAIAAGLVCTFSRAGWIAALVGLAIVGLCGVRSVRRRGFVVAAGIAGLAAAIGLARPDLAEAVLSRAGSLFDPVAGSAGTRLNLWSDSIRLVASRPFLGYGPDTFGLVYPSFQTGDWTPGSRADKAHAELLQVAATQGLVGVVASLALLAAVVRAFAARTSRGAGIGIFAGVVAYLAALMPNFTAVPSALPFWLLLAVGIVTWGSVRERRVRFPGAPARPLALAAAAAVLVLTSWSVVRPYAADVSYRRALEAVAGAEPAPAAEALAAARRLAPEQARYAAAAGDLWYAVGSSGGGADAWVAARDEYAAAAALGAAEPLLFRRLARAEDVVGRREAALAAAERAVQLGPFDPRNRALLEELARPRP